MRKRRNARWVREIHSRETGGLLLNSLWTARNRRLLAKGCSFFYRGRERKRVASRAGVRYFSIISRQISRWHCMMICYSRYRGSTYNDRSYIYVKIIFCITGYCTFLIFRTHRIVIPMKLLRRIKKKVICTQARWGLFFLFVLTRNRVAFSGGHIRVRNMDTSPFVLQIWRVLLLLVSSQQPLRPLYYTVVMWERKREIMSTIKNAAKYISI